MLMTAIVLGLIELLSKCLGLYNEESEFQIVFTSSLLCKRIVFQSHLFI